MLLHPDRPLFEPSSPPGALGLLHHLSHRPPSPAYSAPSLPPPQSLFSWDQLFSPEERFSAGVLQSVGGYVVVIITASKIPHVLEMIYFYKNLKV